MKHRFTRNIKFLNFAVLFLLAALFSTGCILSPIVKIGPASAPFGLVATNVTGPNEIDIKAMKVIPYDPSEIEILGWYEKKESSSGLNGRLPFAGARDLFAVKNSDYESTYKEIIEQNNLDGLMNITVDTHRYVINLIVIRFTNWHTSVGGVGYRMLEKEPSSSLTHEKSDTR